MPFNISTPHNIIRGLKLKLDLSIKPELISTESRSALEMITALLSYLEIECSILAGCFRQYDRTNLTLLQSLGPNSSADTANLDERIVSELHKTLFTGTQQARELAAGVIESFESFHRNRHDALQLNDAHISQSKMANLDIQSALRDYLVKRFKRPFGRFSSFTRIPGGFSKETFIIELAPNNTIEGCDKIVLRMDTAGLPTDVSVVDEYPFIERCYRENIPVAQPLWCETDTQNLGEAFQVTKFTEGTAGSIYDKDLTAWGTDPALRSSTAKDVARILARLHSMAVENSTTNDPVDVIRDNLLAWRTKYDLYWQKPEPVVEILYEWLLRNIPKTINKTAWLHGDFGPHNMLVQNGKVQAVLDWELIHLGDPVEDLAYCKPLLEPVIAWEDFLQVYYDHGGTTYAPESALYYEVWRNIKPLVIMGKFRYLFDNGINRDIRMLYPSLELYNHFVQTAVDLIKKDVT
jgi:aminoglycoside phosphotransferase (APT) family kinase protein